MQADVEISFEVNDLEKAQALNPSWKMDPQHLCTENGSKVKETGLGPFGLLVLASKNMQEYTSIFFKVFRANKKHVVLMCSDQSRYLSLLFHYPSNSHQTKVSIILSNFFNYRSSLNHKNDLTTYGAFVDVNPIYDELSIRTLVSSNYDKFFLVFFLLKHLTSFCITLFFADRSLCGGEFWRTWKNMHHIKSLSNVGNQ